MHCRKCRRAAKLNVRQLVETRGAKIDLKEVLASYICENCGAVWPYIDAEVPRDGKGSRPQDHLPDADPNLAYVAVDQLDEDDWPKVDRGVSIDYASGSGPPKSSPVID